MEKSEKLIALRSLKANLGWTIIVDILKENVSKLGEELLDDINSNIDQKEKDKMILKRYFQKKLIELPDTLINLIEQDNFEDETDLDPYDID